MAEPSQNEVDAFMRRFWLILFACIVVILVPIFLAAFYMERRLDRLADALRYREPVATDDVTIDTEMEQTEAQTVQGQTVYVPAYSHVYHEDGKPHLVTITLSIRNTSLEREIVVTSVRYFDTTGTLVNSYLEKPLKLAPLATTEFLVERDDSSGGSGANFLVEWVTNQPVTEPIIEAVMIDTSSQQGISFARRGVVLKEKLPESRLDPNN